MLVCAFRLRSSAFFSFFEFTSGDIINAKHLSIMQIVQSHFAQAGQRNIIRVEHMSLSVRALQWRLACTTSSVLFQRR